MNKNTSTHIDPLDSLDLLELKSSLNKEKKDSLVDYKPKVKQKEPTQGYAFFYSTDD